MVCELPVPLVPPATAVCLKCSENASSLLNKVILLLVDILIVDARAHRYEHILQLFLWHCPDSLQLRINRTLVLGSNPATPRDENRAVCFFGAGNADTMNVQRRQCRQYSYRIKVGNSGATGGKSNSRHRSPAWWEVVKSPPNSFFECEMGRTDELHSEILAIELHDIAPVCSFVIVQEKNVSDGLIIVDQCGVLLRS